MLALDCTSPGMLAASTSPPTSPPSDMVDELSPSTPTSTSQSTITIITTPAERASSPLPRRRSPSPGIMKADNDVHMDMLASFSSSSSSSIGRLVNNGMSAAQRRASRFDPMTPDAHEVDDEGYGELGHRHPLRRVKEEGIAGDNSDVRLPGFRALFGVAGAAQHPPTPSTSTTPPYLFSTPGLPALAPHSPSGSPSATARTSRYSSLASSVSLATSAAADFQVPSGWWAPDLIRTPDRISPLHPPHFRNTYFPPQTYTNDEPDAKRRRSDLPVSTHDADEAARLRWMAQSRNASFPLSGSTSAASGHSLPSYLPPPPGLSGEMSRQSMSGSPGLYTPLSPRPGVQADFSFEIRRPSAAISSSSRSPSLVGGQLARAFGDLSATEKLAAQAEMLPPLRPQPQDRRPSVMSPMSSMEDVRRLPHPSSLRASIAVSSSPSADGCPGSRPATPDSAARPPLHRASLTELIMAKSGDDRAMSIGRFGGQAMESSPMNKPSLSEPTPDIWPLRRGSGESDLSTPAIVLNSDDEGPPKPNRRRKRVARPRVGSAAEDIQGEPSVIPLLSRAEVFPESARRAAGESSFGRDDSPDIASFNGLGAVAGPKYQCEYCNKLFSRPSSLRIHTYSHTGERPFVCQEPSCGRSFSVQSNLKRHAKVHQLGVSGHTGGASSQQLNLPAAQLRGPGGTAIHPPPHPSYSQSNYTPPLSDSPHSHGQSHPSADADAHRHPLHVGGQGTRSPVGTGEHDHGVQDDWSGDEEDELDEDELEDEGD